MINTFWLVLGYACNNRCPHCYATPSGFSKKWINKFFAKDVIRTLKHNGAKTCLLIGGEPTLYPSLVELLLFGSKIGLKMIIVSNGRRFKNKEFTKRLFEAGLEKTVISIEGSTKDVHNNLTGRNSFQETVKGIETCAKIGKVNTLTTICKENSLQIPEIIKIVYQLGANKAILNCAIPIVSKNEIVAEHSLSPLDIADVVEKTFWKLYADNLPFQINTTFPLCLLKKETIDTAINLDWLSIGCHMYRGEGIIFDPKGNILPCTHFSEMPLIKNVVKNGKVFSLKNNLLKIWDNPRSVAGKFRSALWRYPSKECVTCEYWGACIGGCPLLWMHFDPQIYIKKGEKNESANRS